MNQASLTSLQQDHVRRLVRLATELTAGLSENQRLKVERLAALEQQSSAETAQLERQASECLDQLNHDLTTALSAARVQFEARAEELETQRGSQSDEILRQRQEALRLADDDCEVTGMRLSDEYQRDLDRLQQQQKQFTARVRSASQALEQRVLQTHQLLGQRGLALPQLPNAAAAADPSTWSSTWLRQHDATVQQLDTRLQEFRRSLPERYLREGWSVLLFLAIGAALAYPVGRLAEFQPLMWAPAVLGGSALLTGAVHFFLRQRATQRLARLALTLAQELSAAQQHLQWAQQASQRETKAGADELAQQRKEHVAASRQERDERRTAALADAARQAAALEQTYRKHLAQAEQAWEHQASEIRQRYRPLIDQRREFFAAQRARVAQTWTDQQLRITSAAAETEQNYRETWRAATERCHEFVQSLQIPASSTTLEHVATLDPKAWLPAQQPPAAVVVGQYQFRLPAGAEPLADVALPPRLPALLTFPTQGSLVLTAGGDGRAAAVRVLQNAVLQMLAAFPPGKLRLTIIDPIGLGQSFSAFMHLADFDERLVTHRIWTEAAQINQRLADLTEHMENVIQKYLRNEYNSIQEYNQFAGEVAEPFRVLVIADYPHQFSDEATRRLLSIAQSGPRCGIFTFLSVDPSVPLSRHIQLSDLTTNAQVFRWDGTGFVNDQEPFVGLPLQLDEPPAPAVLTQVIKQVGQRAQETRRVQVPFSVVAPAANELWSGDCRDELVVPLGRTGATQRLALKLGHGTSQHVLIAGKTGSGKSTLLHALITNAALYYSPDQVQFYLIDFKKGVEFKTYADAELPHARVIAIESEREFGLSVLQRLDLELRRRGDLFRDAGVQNLAAYRTKFPSQSLPRILFVVDEFQEFFVSDDKISHEAALLLDRMVRQGRAFGMHVILGSQTLAGAYSLARSTIGQMAVRIALECSAADAHLILSEDNSAARLLGRPGEAIYNDANGLVEGNHPFQIVWLPDRERLQYLGQLQALARATDRHDEPPIVFEGHAAAEISNNGELHQRLQLAPRPAGRRHVQAWLGTPIAIKEPTRVTLRRQSGCNLLIVGQSRELAVGMLSGCVISLLAEHTRATTAGVVTDAQFWLLDGDRLEVSTTDFADRLHGYLPQAMQVAGPDTAAEAIARVTEALEQRQADASLAASPMYLVIMDLARFRELQTASDDYGLGSFGSGTHASPAAQLAKILRDGPGLGIHTLLWADCYHTLTRWLERASLRDFGQRVLLQMSAVDSSHLMDSAAASQLGAYRALLYDHDRGQAEKFRPYGPPSDEWLSWCQQQLTQPTRVSS